MKAWTWMVLLLCLLASPAFAQQPRASVAPKDFEISIGGFSGPSYRVVLDSKGHLIYFRDRMSPYEKRVMPEEITVSDKQWLSFRKRLDQANVWKWKSQYIDSDIADGTVWGMEIDFGDKHISSVGSNKYPRKEEFDAYLKAVSELLGGRDFK